MNGLRNIFKVLVLSTANALWAEENDSTVNVLSAIEESRVGMWQLAELSHANPAVNQWRMNVGLTEISAGYFSRMDKGKHDIRDGTGAHNFKIGAETYTKYRSSTLWGSASYAKGKIRSVKWNETAHRELIYPYVLADSVGGDFYEEIYSFSGGYADCRDRLAWGACLSYEATLQYRNVDPRPRNIAGNLEVSGGVMYRIFGAYYTGLGIDLMKYKQTNDILFKSEMGVDKVYHLTGLGNHYKRFAGTGLSTYYNGYRCGIGLNLYPENGRGFFASGRLCRFTFDNIISDLNRLPMASAWHNQLEVQGGWMTGGASMYGGVSGKLTLYRRHGTENIFGDAASSVYPLICSNEMFADNAVKTSLTGRCGWRSGSLNRVQLSVTPEWGHRTMVYIEPYTCKVLNHTQIDAEVYWSAGCGKWLVELSANVGIRAPYNCSMTPVAVADELKGLADAENGAYLLESSRLGRISVLISSTRRIGRYAAGLCAEWKHESYKGSIKRNLLKINITFSF